ncbi:succinate--CoA ligase subunit alpha [Candidatus Saccharibacteria bacterium]|nr:succinate--CoA ligase subunit alpha [Candidatus Saccharibacteria bacterium]
MFERLLSRPPVLVQGITGSHGLFHTKGMLAAGTNVVCGVTPGKGGQEAAGVPVYNSVKAAVAAHQPQISVVFVPAPFAKEALLEAIEAGITFIVVITEHIPVHDMLAVMRAARRQGVTILGPNCPGILIPDIIKLGIIPASVGRPGDTAIVSRSGTLTYEAAASLGAAGIGQYSIVGIGGDRMRGVSFVDCLAAFEADAAVRRIVLIGEIGGQDELRAADYIARHVSKPVYAYVVGHSAPPETRLGHAGAIMGSQDESAAAKTAALADAGAITADSLPALIARLAES